MRRESTYIDDIVEGVVRIMDTIPAPDPAQPTEDPDPARSHAPYRVDNIGNSRSVALEDLIATLEHACGRSAERVPMPMQPGDVPATYASIEALEAATGWRPVTPIEAGGGRAWWRGIGHSTASRLVRRGVGPSGPSAPAA